MATCLQEKFLLGLCGGWANKEDNMALILLIIVWTWGLTPLWANIVCSCLVLAHYVWRFLMMLARYGEH